MSIGATVLTTVVPALLPAASDGVRALLGRFGKGKGAQPLNIKERIELVDADTRRLEALVKLDNVGQVSQWVNDVRAMQRPVAAALVLLTWMVAYALQADDNTMAIASDLASAVVFYLFGDRTYMHLRRQG